MQPRYIRITDFGDDGIKSGHEFVTADPIEPECVLAADDLLFARSGATVGKTYLHEDTSEPAIFAGYCIRFRFNREIVLPRLVYWFTKTGFYARWVATIQRPAGQPNINKEEFKSFEMPLPADSQVQAHLVAEMDAARAARRAKLAEADALLAGLDGFLLDTLGLTPPPKDERKVFAIRRASAPTRFDPHFHAPEFARIQEMLAATSCEPLGNFTGFSKETWNPLEHREATFRYIEISGVTPQTGEASWSQVPTAEAPSRARMSVRENDIIVSLTRPHHGSIAHLSAEFAGCVASTGFAVIRNVADRVRRDYLWCVLRVQFCLRQMLQRASGGNYPAITEVELARVLVPVPAPDVQETIAAEVRRRRDEARRLRAEAEAEWQAAKRWFEDQLLGPAQP
jgi:hypothetical protein